MLTAPEKNSAPHSLLDPSRVREVIAPEPQSNTIYQNKASSRVPRELIELIEKAQMISLDVFDTLLCRAVARPTDIFQIVEREFGIEGFHKERIRAESRARELSITTSKTAEVSIDQIYLELRRGRFEAKKIDFNALQEREIYWEETLLSPTPMGRELFDLCLSVPLR